MLFALLLFLTLFLVPSAQTPPENAIKIPADAVKGTEYYFFADMYGVYWEEDSSAVHVPVTVADERTFLRFELSTGQAEIPAHNPQTVQLTPKDQEHYRANDAMAFLAPDGQKIVYSTSFTVFKHGLYGEGYYTNLWAWADYVGPDQNMDAAFGLLPDDFSPEGLIWSADGSVIYHSSMTNNGFQLWQLHRLSGEELYVDTFDVSAACIRYQRIFDMTPDGANILYLSDTVGEQDALTQPFICQLTVWRSNLPDEFAEKSAVTERRIYDETNVIGAGFILDNAQAILVADSQKGILLLDLKTGTTTILNPDVTDSWAWQVIFSPDAQWALVSANGGWYIVPTGLPG
ncbi:MAG TPA: hypothetical protein VHO69_04535 [Phototrophicaceae bacterium]|nr:hypothetical protein [Phototrophicaceae bacterium]